ncbi:MAG: hypothetical protein U5R31_08440, partial [Acidimicrobiia bacterium]|nr:hypothetical protein [Acidimicrobiia bacterium]
MRGSTFNRNTADGDGGAIVQWRDSLAEIKDSALHGNRAGDTGGAIAQERRGELNLSNSTLSGDTFFPHSLGKRSPSASDR